HGLLRLQGDQAVGALEEGMRQEREAGVLWKPERAQLLDRLAREPAGARLRADLVVLLENQYLTAGIGQDLGGAQPRRAGAHDDVFDGLHGPPASIGRGRTAGTTSSGGAAPVQDAEQL